MDNLMKHPRIVIIVVNYKLKADTIDCIQSLLNAKATISDLIVVDNASNDGSVEAIRGVFGPDLRIIEAEDNKGYPHALNIGIPIALEMGADWALLMNNDVLVDANFLTELERAILAYPKYRLIAPMILYHAAPDRIWFLGSKAIPGTIIGVRSYRGVIDTGDFPEILDIDFVHGCTMMVHREVFEKIGMFDDEQIIYGDDADFSWRARLAGFKMAAVTKAKMWHKISLTMGRQKPKTVYLRTRNTILFYKRYAKNLQLLIMFLFTTARGIILSIRYLFKNQTDLLGPMFYAWLDGWAGKKPERYG